mmetsp:Transcript_3832/g.7344  ORF Transcript_3832/g.7344 Transcript_3832/m.7344 type:complete len:105 (+) Transcript_3832:1579-1893(+)
MARAYLRQDAHVRQQVDGLSVSGMKEKVPSTSFKLGKSGDSCLDFVKNFPDRVPGAEKHVLWWDSCTHYFAQRFVFPVSVSMCICQITAPQRIRKQLMYNSLGK